MMQDKLGDSVDAMWSYGECDVEGVLGGTQPHSVLILPTRFGMACGCTTKCSHHGSNTTK